MTDFSLFDTYRRQNTRCRDYHDYCDVDYLLRFWRENKAKYLMPLFGDQLILERPITYTRSDDELRRDMRQMTEDMYQYSQRVLNKLYRALHSDDDCNTWIEDMESSYFYRYMSNTLNNANYLIDNSIYVPNLLYYMDTPPMAHTFKLNTGKGINIQSGQKITRVWGTLSKMLGCEEDWEKIRVAHSLVLNQKKLKGTLCLSIHPLDYATASDNDNGWSSCMSWQEEGCYRMGTVEMMNSPMVICAYVKSDKQHMEIDGEEWNSKKWRAWIIVNKDLILCNRHYPYHQPVFAKEACNWVRELVYQQYGWEYDDVHEDFYTYMDDTLGTNTIEITTNYMYNDLGDTDIIGMLREDKRKMPDYINFSGPAECMVCGDEIRPDQQGADRLECEDCYTGEWYCNCCGDSIAYEDDCYTDPDGNTICRDCWEQNCTTCECCDDTIWADDVITVTFPVYRARAKKYLETSSSEFLRGHFSDWTGHLDIPATTQEVRVCPHCAQKYSFATVDFADMTSSDEIDIDGEIDTVDPTKMSMEEAFDLLAPQDWYWATHYGARNHKEDAAEIVNFWTDQWEAFKADFINSEIVDDE